MRRAWFRCLLVACLAIVLGAHAMNTRRAENEKRERTLQALKQLSMISTIVTQGNAKTNRRVFINGQPTFFGVATVSTDMKATLDGIRHECEGGDLGVRLESDTGGDHANAAAPETLKLTRMERQEVEGGQIGASLCVFKSMISGDDDGDNEGEARRTRIRYTLVHRLEDGRASVFTVATECGATIETLFPMEGDAPGGDLAGIPRPRGSRRTFAATVEGDSYAVRVYESKAALPDVIALYDQDMSSAGFTSSPTVANLLPNVRSYTRGQASLVASFETGETGETVVSIAPVSI
jgi:hypothetical protein